MKRQIQKSLLYGIVVGVSFFVISSIVTSLIPNSVFQRMTPVTILDYTFAVITSFLLGIFVFLRHHHKSKNITCAASGAGGTAGGFLGFGCSVCNKILILIFGVAGVLAYIEPYRPLIGLAGIGLLGYAVSLEISKNGIFK